MATVPTLETHNVLLHDGTVANTVGLILQPDKAGTILRRYPAPPLADQQFQTLGQQAFVPQLEQPFSINTNHGGFGKEIWADKRYRVTYGVDASVKNSIKLSPVLVAMTNSNPTTTGYNMGFETWTSATLPDYWAQLYSASGNPQKDTSIFQGGAASLRRPTFDVTMRHPLGVTAVSGSIITVTIYGRAITTDGTITWKLYNALDTQLATQADTVTAGAGWVQKTFAYTFVGTVSVPILEVALSTDTANGAWIDTAVIAWTGTALTTLTPGTIVKAVDFNSNHYFVSDTGVWKQSAGDLVWVGGSPPGITDAYVDASGDYLVLCRGQSLAYWLMRKNEDYLVNSGGTVAERGAVINGLNYHATTDTNVSKMNSLLAGTATTNYTIGSSADKITKLLEHVMAGVISPFIIKESSAYYINSSGTVVFIDAKLASLDNTNTGKNTISWSGDGAQVLYIPAGSDSTLMVYDDGLTGNVGPIEFIENLTDFEGQILATAADDKYLYIIVDNSTKIEILKGRYETIDGATDFRLHPIVEDTYGTVGFAHISNIVTAKRLYYGGGGSLPKYISLAGGSYATGGIFITPWINLGLPNILKNFRSVALRTSGLTANVTVKVEYNLDGETSWTELGGSGNGTYSTSPYQEKFLGTSSAGVNSRRIQFRFTLATNSASVSPEIIDFTLNYVLNPPLLYTIEFDAMVGGQRTLTGMPDDEMTYDYVATKLRSWTTTIPLTLIIPNGLWDASDNGNHDGESLLVHFAPGGFYENTKIFPNNDPHEDMKGLFSFRFFELRTT